jgi:hypothetical protein
MLQASVGKLTQSSFLINNMDISFNYEVRREKLALGDDNGR